MTYTYEAVERMNELYMKKKRASYIPDIVIGIGLLGVIISVTALPSLLGISIVALVIEMIVCACYVKPTGETAMRELRSIYKDTFLNGMFGEFFEDACYEGWWGFSEIEVMEMSLYKLGNKFESEDKLSGQYRGVWFKQSDVHIWEHVTTGDDDRDIDYFEGRMFVFDTPLKNIESVKIFNRLSFDDKNDHRLRLEEENRVSMESMEFNDRFSVYAKKAHDAFYVLTPDMMERITEIYYKYCKMPDGKMRDMSLHFRDDKLYCALETYGNAFDPGTYPISYPEEKAKLKKDIQVIMDIIESLDLVDEKALIEKEVEDADEIVRLKMK